MGRVSSGFVSFSGTSTRRRSPFITRLALVLSFIAVVIILFIALTVFSSNRLMNVKGNIVTNVPSNILPSYSTTSFQSADGQTSLQGWFFKTKNPTSTIIVVHDSGSNRLPFGVEMIDMIEGLGGQVVGISVVMELAGLKGREKLAGYRLDSCIIYPGA